MIDAKQARELSLKKRQAKIELSDTDVHAISKLISDAAAVGSNHTRVQVPVGQGSRWVDLVIGLLTSYHYTAMAIEGSNGAVVGIQVNW